MPLIACREGQVRNVATNKCISVTKLEQKSITKNVTRLSQKVKDQLRYKLQNVRNRMKAPLVYSNKHHKEYCEGVRSTIPSNSKPITYEVEGLPVISYTKYNEHIVHKYFDPKLLPDDDWLEKARAYIENLSDIDMSILGDYTFDGYTYINELLSNNKSKPSLLAKIPYFSVQFIIENRKSIKGNMKKYITNRNVKFQGVSLENYLFSTQDKDMLRIWKEAKLTLGDDSEWLQYFKPAFWKEMFDTLRLRLHNMFLNAPKTTKSMYLYRGYKTPRIYLEKAQYNQSQKSYVINNNVLISTSISPVVASDFAGLKKSTGAAYMSRILIKPGSSLLFLVPASIVEGELEVLLPPGSTFKIKAAEKLVMMPIDLVSDICNENVRKVYFTEMEYIV